MKYALVIVCLALAPLCAFAQNLRDYQDEQTTVITVRDMSECPVSAQNSPARAQEEHAAQNGEESIIVRSHLRVVCMTLTEITVRCATARMGFNAEMLTFAGAALSESGDLHLNIAPDDAPARFCNEVRRVNEARRQFLREVAQKREHYEGALDAARAAVVAQPNDLAAQHELMAELMNVGDVEMAQRDFPKARLYYEESQTIARTLAATRPDNTSLQWDLYSSSVKLANLDARVGDDAMALRAREESLALAERVAAQNPDAGAWRRAVYVGAAELGDMQVRGGDVDGARARLERSLALARSQQNPESQRDIAAILISLGRAQVAGGDLAGAQQSLEASLAAQRAINGPELGVAATLQQLGDVQSQRGDFAGAMTSYRQNYEIARRIARADLRNEIKQRELAMAAQRVGDAQIGLGNVDAARTSYQESLSIARRLARLYPNEANRRRDVWVAMQRLAANVPGAVSWADVAHYMERLDRRGLLEPSDKHWLEEAQSAARGGAPAHS